MLIQRRLGLDAVRSFDAQVVSYLSVVLMNEAQHNRSIASVVGAGQRRLSLVDCSSFIVCHDLAIDEIFAFNRHFERQGFRLARGS